MNVIVIMEMQGTMKMFNTVQYCLSNHFLSYIILVFIL